MKSNKVGICPVCNSEIETGSPEIENGQVRIDWVCSECLQKGTEWFNLVFTSHTFRV